MTKSHLAGLLLLILLPLTAYGQKLTIAEPGDKKLVIKGSIGDDNSFIGHIGVILEEAQGTTPIKLNIYPSDLKIVSTTSTEMIRRGSVAVTGDQNLTPDTLSTFQVKVSGVKEPGEYRGNISLVLAGQQHSSAQPVEVTLFASVRPALSLLTENDRVQANLVNCTICPLAYLLLSAGAFQDTREVGFEKPLGAPLAISNVTIAVKGDQNKFQVNKDQLTVPLDKLPQSPAGQKYLSLPVTIVRAKLPADHYTGNIYLTVDGQSNALKVPVDFNVRIAPLWPLLVLIAGIVLGRLFKFMQDKGNAIADALESINRLEFRLRNVNPDDAAIIMPMLSAARDLVHQDKVAEAVAAVNAISSRLSALTELRQIQARLTGKEGDTAVVAILSDIRTAREHIRLQQDENAKELIKRIKEALVALSQTGGLTDSDATDLGDAEVRADSALAAVAGLGTVKRTTGSRLRSAMVTISGLTNQFRNEATLVVVRPLLWFALLLGLVALGMKTLYVDNPVFGASPFADFLGLVFWGLSTDVASRTLSGLSLNNPSRPAGR